MLSHSRLWRSFIERPKPSGCQAATWSDCKHHNTIKFLVGISRLYYIFKLMLWQVNLFFTKESDFYDLVERDDVVMADHGFQI